MSTDEKYRVEDLLKLPGEGETTNSDMVIKARAIHMEGDFSVMEGVIKPQELLAPHTHDHEAQLVYVISGELEFEVGGKDGYTFKAPAGSYVLKPKGLMHAFWNKGGVESRYIEISGKPYFEGFVDSKSNGDVDALMNAKKDWGMNTHVKDSIRLIKKHNLNGLSMLNLPAVNKLIKMVPSSLVD